MKKPDIIIGGCSVDDRGFVRHINDFDFKGIKRFYVVENHRPGFVRAWHGHKYESKWALVVEGSVYFKVAKVSDFSNPDQITVGHHFTFNHNLPTILFIPAGWAHGYKTLTDKAKIIFFSDKTLEQSQKDDFRWQWNYFNVGGHKWEEDFR